MQRRYDIDLLRNLGILLLFPFHAARIFDVWDPFYVKNVAPSQGLSWLVALIAFWFMPLLFWLAGSASWYALRRRTDRQYVGERFSRLFVPFVAGTLIVVPPQGYIATRMPGGEPGGYLEYLTRFFADFSDLSGYTGAFTPAHLWFILYLFVFSLIGLPMFRALIRRLDDAPVRRAMGFLSRPQVFVLLFVPLTAVQALPAPGGQNPFYYFFIYAAGFLACAHPDFEGMLAKCRFPALLALAVTVPVWVWMLDHFGNLSGFSPAAILFTLLRTLNVWLTLIAITGYGLKLRHVRPSWLRYANEAAFPVYIVHQTVIVVIGWFIVQQDWNLYVKFAVILISSFAASCLLYEAAIRRLAPLRLLFGVKSAPPPRAKMKGT
jgi:fucose 4-O-acetylase-like acetyltransferase